MIIPINTNTVAVETEADLRSAVGNNTINYIYLANNITITAGVTIYAGKASLVIDGEYPLNSGVRNEFTDVNSTSYYDTFGIGSTSSIALTFRNMIIHGRNYYGVPYIVETIAGITNTDNVSVIYENVRYTGPQMTYNCNGLTRYIDCDITIEQTGAAESQEVGEVNRVELGGRTTIVHTSSLNNRAVFWFRGVTGTMSLTVLEGAEINVNSVNSYFMYNMDTTFFTPHPVPYIIHSGASFNLTVNRGISFDYRNQVSSFLVEQNASFRYIQTANNGTSSSLYINGALTVQQGVRFYMQAANSAEPLIQFTSGTGRSLTVSNPFSFVLYCANDPALISAGTTQVSLHGGQLNTWSTPEPLGSAGGFEDTPEHKWYKTNYATSVEFTGSFTQTTTSVTGNLVQEDPPHPPDTDLHLHAARVISIGDWPVMVNPVEDDGSAITGSTEPGANMRIIYTIDSVVHTINGAAGADGRFSIGTSQEVPPNIPAGTEVAIWSNIPFLIKDMRTTAIEVGSLLITSAPDTIVFTVPPISTNPVLLPRINPREPVLVYDDRGDRSRWELLASITDPFQTEFGDILPDAVVFMENAGGELVTLSGTPIVVHTADPVLGTTEVSWSEDEGILIHVTRPLHMGVRYFTTVNWELHVINEL